MQYVQIWGGKVFMSKGNAGGDLRRFYIIFAVVALVGVGTLGYTMASRALGTAVTEPVDLSGVDDMAALMEMAVPQVRGDESAPITIIYFSDYLCPHCATFSLRIRPLVESNFVETGQAKVVFYDFPLIPGSGAFLAARAARCAGDQGRFWEYHDYLYRTQYTWGMEADKEGIFQEYAGEMGLDAGEFRGCLMSDRHAQEVTANQRLAQSLGLGGTPSVLVGSTDGMSRRLPDYAYETIEEAVRAIQGG